MKQKVANAFLDRFQLKQHEVEVLKNTRNEAITAVSITSVVPKTSTYNVTCHS